MIGLRPSMLPSPLLARVGGGDRPLAETAGPSVGPPLRGKKAGHPDRPACGLRHEGHVPGGQHSRPRHPMLLERELDVALRSGCIQKVRPKGVVADERRGVWTLMVLGVVRAQRYPAVAV